jgi:hypothetical protein
MGFLIDPENAVVWRGLMVMKALQQLLHEVDWGELDVLVLDLPPGTGDTQLTITQQVELDGESTFINIPEQLWLMLSSPHRRSCYFHAAGHRIDRRGQGHQHVFQSKRTGKSLGNAHAA